MQLARVVTHRMSPTRTGTKETTSLLGTTSARSVVTSSKPRFPGPVRGQRVQSPVLNSRITLRCIIWNIGQHKAYEKERSWFQLLLCFLLGTLLVAACLYYYHFSSPSIIGTYGIGKVLGLGIIFMAAPIWAYFRKRKHRSRKSAG
jgi:hypothetical protein